MQRPEVLSSKFADGRRGEDELVYVERAGDLVILARKEAALLGARQPRGYPLG